jgi:hypothetical protein
MANNVIEILIQATDKTGNVVTGIAGKLGSALGGTLKLGAMGAGAGLGAMAGFLTLATKEAIEAEQVQAELNAVLKSTNGIAGVTADAATELASKWSKVTMFSDDAVLSGENMLLTFTNIGSDVFPQATEATINLAQKFGSMESAATQVGKALNDPTEGVSALTRVGVSFTEQQKEQIRAMQESGDLAGAQGIILSELERQYGGLAVAAGDTLAGKFTILKNKFLDVAEGVGMQLIPALSQGLDYAVQFGDWAAPKITQVTNAVIDLWVKGQPYLSQFASWFSTTGGPGIVSFIQNDVVPAVLTIATAISDFWTDAKPYLDEFSTWFRNDALPAIITFIREDAIPTLGSIGAEIMDLWEQAKPYLAEFGAWFIADALPAIVAFIKDPVLPTIDDIATGITVLWNTVSPYLSQFYTWFTVTALPAAMAFINNTALPRIRDLRDALANLWNDVQPGLSSMYNWFRDSLGWVKSNVVDPLVDALSTLKNTWNDVKNSGVVKWAGGALNTLGFAEGGYTGGGPSSQVAGVVHRNEWVVPERGALVLRGDGGGAQNITVNVTDSVMATHPNATAYGQELAASIQSRLRFAGGGVVAG